MSGRPMFTAFKQRLLENPAVRNAYERSRRVHAAQDALHYLECWVESGDSADLLTAIATLERAE